MNNQIFYIVIRNQSEIIGLFDSEEMAKKACRTCEHGYGSISLNVDLGDKSEEWSEFIYPLEDKPKGRND